MVVVMRSKKASELLVAVSDDRLRGVLMIPSVAGRDVVRWGFRDVGRAGAERMRRRRRRRRRRVRVDGAGEEIDAMCILDWCLS